MRPFWANIVDHGIVIRTDLTLVALRYYILCIEQRRDTMYSVSDCYGFIARNVATLEEAAAIAREWTAKGCKGVMIRDSYCGEIVTGW